MGFEENLGRMRTSEEIAISFLSDEQRALVERYDQEMAKIVTPTEPVRERNREVLFRAYPGMRSALGQMIALTDKIYVLGKG